MTDFRIWGKKVPCTVFLGDEGLTEEKKKELWVMVKSNNDKVQAWIDKNIWYAGTIANKIYLKLIDDPKKIFYL